MAGKNKGPDELDVMALLHEVHGSEAGARGEAVEVALRAMEVTHRQASLAMRQFEQSGRVGSGATARPQAAARPRQHAEPASAKPASGPQGRALPAPAAIRQDDPQVAPPSGGAPAAQQEVTAVWRKPQPAEAKQFASVSARSAPPVGQDAPAAKPQVFAGNGAEVQLREPTRTQVLPRPKK